MSGGANTPLGSRTATVHRLPTAEPAKPDSLIDRVLRLLKLQVELGVAEVKRVAKSALVAVAVAVLGFLFLIASLVVLITGGVVAMAGGVSGPLVIAGGGVALISLAALGWSIWLLRNLEWPRETVTSLQTNSRWLGAKLKSTLTMPGPRSTTRAPRI
jgi:Putative Actinobacterial Holin-X, holin superfamily III